MRILFDQATPVGIRKFLTGHQVKTAFQQGWDTLKNGDLIRMAEDAGFDVFLTTDKNLAYQQNLKNRKIAILVLGNGQWPDLCRHGDRIAGAINTAAPGSYALIEIPAVPSGE